jgi:hypothetical protein
LEYGDFDINITVQPIILLFHQGISKPLQFIVLEQNRLAKAKLSDKLFYSTEEEVAALANSTSTATKTWHFKLKKLGFVLGFFSGIYFRWS